MSSPYPDMIPFFLHSATSAGAGGGDEDPHKKPFRLKSAHETDAPGPLNPYQEEAEADKSAQAKKIKRHYPAEMGSFGPCPICQRSFKSSKALHGHMRCHPDRAWRGMVPPEKWGPHVRGGKMASAAEGPCGEGIEWPFRCRDCGANFRTKQALGGHRASHKSKKGCFMMAREGLPRLLHGANINNNNHNNNNNNNNNINNNNNAGIRNNGGAHNNIRVGAGQGSRIVDLNLPPPQEEEEEDEEQGAGKG